MMDDLPCSKEGSVSSRNVASTGNVPQPWPGILAIRPFLEHQLLRALHEEPHMHCSRDGDGAGRQTRGLAKDKDRVHP
jgi:hypothetical protein